MEGPDVALAHKIKPHVALEGLMCGRGWGAAPPDPPDKSAASAASSSVATLGPWGPRAPPLWPGKATSGPLWPQATPSVAWQGHIRPPAGPGRPPAGPRRPPAGLRKAGFCPDPAGARSRKGRVGLSGSGWPQMLLARPFWGPPGAPGAQNGPQ